MNDRENQEKDFMKRYLLIVVLLIVMVLVGYYFYYMKGFYVDIRKETTITTPFYIDNKTIYQKRADGNQEFVIRGVEMDSSYGPKRATDFAIDEETYLRWFEQIQQMGANTIRVSTILDDNFYKAFYEYNKDRKQPLFLLQGIRVATDEFKTKRNKDYFDFYQTLLKDGRDVIDIIHGKKVILTNKHKGSGFYFYDISPWVVGILIGDEWDQDTISYLNHTLDKEPAFIGEYVTTTEQSTNFEIMMAKVIENIVRYESKKYHSQRPISVNSTFLMDPFQYQEHYAVQIEKKNAFNIDRIKPTAQMKAGLFASYAYEDFDFSLLPLIDSSELKSFSDVKNYFELLNRVHEVPVIISSIGYPSDSYFHNTKKQEHEIVEKLKMFDSLGYNGNVIRSWQDVWDRRAFETSYAVDLQQINEWHDPLTSTQHFGLIGFKPYRGEVLMQVDGNDDDWQDVVESFQNETTKVLMTRDHAFLYFWLEDPAITNDQPFYIGLDLHPELGSKTPLLFNITFDRNIDFLIVVNPLAGARVYVHERYQGVRQNFLELTNGRNPYFYYPDKDSNNFEIVKYLKRNKKILTEEELLLKQRRIYHYYFKDMELLKLFNGQQTEQSDLAVEDGRIEIRIPYQLLNIYDPLKFTIHDDYYQHYGVEPLQIDRLYLAIGNGKFTNPKSTEIYVEQLKQLDRVKEYIKPSYYAVQNYWKGED